MHIRDFVMFRVFRVRQRGWSLRFGWPVSAVAYVRYFASTPDEPPFLRGHLGQWYFDRTLPDKLAYSDYIRGALFVLALVLLMGAEGGMHAETLTIAQGIAMGTVGVAMLGAVAI